MSRKAPKEVENIVQELCSAKSDVEERRQHVEGVDHCKRLLEDSRNEALTAEGFAKKVVRFGSGSSVSGVFLYKKRCFRRFTETDDDGHVAGRVLRLKKMLQNKSRIL